MVKALKLLPALFASALVSVVAACDGGSEGASSGSADDSAVGSPDVARLPDPLKKAFAAHGGAQALVSFDSIRNTSSGERSMVGAFLLPPDTFVSCSFELETRWDLKNDDLRLDYHRTIVAFAPFAPEFTFSEYLLHTGGFHDGVDNLFGIPGGPMASERWASARRQQLLLHPEVILRQILLNPSLVKGVTAVTLDGKPHARVTVAGPPKQSVDLFVNLQNGEVTKLSAIENRRPSGDTVVEAFFSDWQPAAGGLILPRRVKMTFDGLLIHDETRSAIAVNPALGPEVFVLPGGAQVSIDPAAAARGEKNTQDFEQFISLGFPTEGVQTFIDPVELAPGVLHLRGASHNSLLVEQQNGLVLVDAPISEDRSLAIVQFAASRFPGKSIKHLVSTHHHDDHTAGWRNFVAIGANVIADEAGEKFYRDGAKAKRTVDPDALAKSPRSLKLTKVSHSAPLTLPDPARPIVVYHVPDDFHAADMVVAQVSGVVFVSDLFSPNAGGTPLPAEHLRTAVQAQGIPVTLYAGGHGTTATPAELDAFIGTP
jgi:glyoxylase-like metal-dependent hydrolase (beta-lactamase superfamily II)